MALRVGLESESSARPFTANETLGLTLAYFYGDALVNFKCIFPAEALAKLEVEIYHKSIRGTP